MLPYLATRSRAMRPSRTKVRAGRVIGRALTTFGADPVLTVDTPGGVFRLDARSRTEAGLLWNGEHDSDDIAFLQAVTPANGTFVDIGANVGMIFIPVARRLGRGGRALAIEPVPVNVSRLEDALRRNAFACGIHLLPVAVGRQPGRLNLIKEGSRGASGNAVPALGDGDGTRVDQTTLDLIGDEAGLTRLDTIKMDVEGYELEVLLGALCVLDTFRPTIYGEFHNVLMPRRGASFLDVWTLFEPRGYACYSFAGRCVLERRVTPAANLGNAVLIPEERLALMPGLGITLDR